MKHKNIVHEISQSTSTDIVEIIKPRKHKKIIREIEEATSERSEHETILKPKKLRTQVNRIE